MMRRKDENGFTLVELVISMGMFSIVMLAIMFFLTAGTKSYGHSKSELNLQMESQMLLNQIRDITYSSNYAKYDSTHKALILYDVDPGTDTICRSNCSTGGNSSTGTDEDGKGDDSIFG